VFLSADVKDGDTHTCAARRSVSLRAAGKKPVPPKLIALRCG